jgi:glutaredoxin-related protein
MAAIAPELVATLRTQERQARERRKRLVLTEHRRDNMTTERKILDPAKVNPPALQKMGEKFAETIREIEEAIQKNQVVVVGMAQNPHVKNVRKALRDADVEFAYLEYGSYFSEWSRRLRIKMWSGWPTFPQVFVNGVLFGGEDLTKAALADGTLLGSIQRRPASAGAGGGTSAGGGRSTPGAATTG